MAEETMAQLVEDALERIHTKETFGPALMDAILRQAQKHGGQERTVTLAPKIEVEITPTRIQVEARVIIVHCIRICVIFDGDVRLCVTECHTHEI
jgi:hypothetical protein